MLRPEHLIEYSKARAKLGISDFHQLVEGVTIGGTIVVGGNQNNVRSLLPTMAKLNRLGSVISVAEIDPTKIDLKRTMTFDLMAIAQQLMIAKNEAFHDTITTITEMLTKICIDDGNPVEVGIQIIREQADKIARI